VSVECAILSLEGLLNSQKNTGTLLAKRRGRKGMGLEERLLVSKRMKDYWNNRRSTQARSSNIGDGSN